MIDRAILDKEVTVGPARVRLEAENFARQVRLMPHLGGVD